MGSSLKEFFCSLAFGAPLWGGGGIEAAPTGILMSQHAPD